MFSIGKEKDCMDMECDPYELMISIMQYVRRISRFPVSFREAAS